ncbi:MAG: hypothetical protein RLZZ84_31 [Pseudomonadota bacterium]|jgi:hypothetical protein
MLPALPGHYALSELFVAAAGLTGAWRLHQKSPLAAVGLLPFGLAGLVGAVQIAGDLGGLVIALHQLLSRAGAVFGLTCMVCALRQQSLSNTLVISVMLAVTSVAWPGLVVPVSALLLIAGTALTLGLGQGRAYASAAGFFLLLPAQLIAAALRPAHPAIAWHLFHGLVGIWLFIAARAFLKNAITEGQRALPSTANRIV